MLLYQFFYPIFGFEGILSPNIFCRIKIHLIFADLEPDRPLGNTANDDGIESEALVRMFYPEVQARTRPLQGTETLVSIDKARALLGFEPEYSIREWFDGA